jgi:hypothetical protein
MKNLSRLSILLFFFINLLNTSFSQTFHPKFVWSKHEGTGFTTSTIGTYGGNIAESVASDGNNFIYVAGAFKSRTIDLGPGVTPDHVIATNSNPNYKLGMDNVLVAKYDSCGVPQWVITDESPAGADLQSVPKYLAFVMPE